MVTKVRPTGVLATLALRHQDGDTGRTRTFRKACALGPERTKTESSPSRIGDEALILKREPGTPPGGSTSIFKPICRRSHAYRQSVAAA